MNILREKLGVNDGTGKILFQSTSPVIGKKTELLGEKFQETVQYEVREMDDVISSHDPENHFQRRQGYPEQAQERPYHSDPGEQQKVLGNARKYQPERVLNNNPTAENGPPIITRDGIVLGGNSRAMTLQMVYAKNPEKAAAYRQMLMDNGAQFGIDPKAVAAMKKPVLTRVVSGQLTPEEMARRSREYNQTVTQSLQSEAEGISRARFIGRKSINNLVEGLKDGTTIHEFLSGEKSADFAQSLLDEGVLQQTEISSLTTANGKLNDTGKARVLHLLRGLVLPDYEILTSLPAGARKNLDAAIPTLALSRFRGDGWDLTGAFYEAMRFISKAKSEGTPVENQFFQKSMFSDDLRDNPVVQAMAMLFANGKPKEIRMRMEHYISLANNENAGQLSLLAGLGTTPEQAFRKAFLEDVAFVGNDRIAGFNPAANSRDAAILWAVENGGKNPTVEKIVAKIEKKLAAKKTTPEEKEPLQEHLRELGALQGNIGIEKPKLSSFWKDPQDLSIPEPKKPGEKGALPEATAAPQPKPMTDPEANLPPELQENPTAPPRAQVEFDAETGHAVITFFQSADLSSAPHELFHIFRRAMEDTAMSADGSAHSKEQWKKLCDFVGAKEGQPWTVEMEEKFAEAGLRYLAEGKAPSPTLQPIFEKIKQWFMEIYKTIENIGVEISPQMREFFDNMFIVPQDVADRRLRYAMGKMQTERVETELADPATSGGRFSPDDEALLNAEKNGDLAVVEELAANSEQDAREGLARLEQRDPEYVQAILDNETQESIRANEKAIQDVELRDEFRRQSLECIMNGG